MLYNHKTKQFLRKAMLMFFLVIVSTIVFGQVFTNKEVGKKNADLIDSLKKSEYPYSLPILGAKATKAGYHLPLSAGVSAQYFSQESDLVIDSFFCNVTSTLRTQNTPDTLQKESLLI